MAKPMSVSEFIKDVIRRRGHSAYRVAKLVGCSSSSIQRFLSGRRGLGQDLIDKVCIALDLELIERPGHEGSGS